MRINEDYFSRLFVLCKQNKVSMRAFSIALMKREDLQLGSENNVVSLPALFNDITGLYLQKDESFGIYDDAYWCGSVYFRLTRKSKKPLSYVLLKMPFDELALLYPVYHEMDYSSISNQFGVITQRNTIIELLCKTSGKRLTAASRTMGISLNTLNYYKKDDDHLYAASFDHVYKIAKYFDAPLSLFVKEALPF